MDPWTLLHADRATVVTHLQQAGPACWAIAAGGTRRAYLAQGGRLITEADLSAYATWLIAAYQQMCNLLYQLGVTTLLLMGRLPTGRGAAYAQLVDTEIQMITVGADQLAWYAQQQLRVAVVSQRYPHLHAQVAAATADHTGPHLIYVFREPELVPGMEELQEGMHLVQRLGRMPTRAEVVQAYYGMELPLLRVYVGSGRPRLTNLRPPWISGQEDYYWAAWSPVILTETDWRRILIDHLYMRPTDSNRTYTVTDHAHLQQLYASQGIPIVGLGKQHMGGWMAFPTEEPLDRE